MILTIALLSLAAATYEPTGPNFVQNASFEQWQAGVPVGWTLDVGTCDTWHGTTARQSPDNQDGKVALKLRPPVDPTHEVRLRQAITPDAATLSPDRRLHVSSAVQAFAAGGVVLALHYRQGDTEHAETATANGTGIWERLALEFVLPPDVDPASLAITLTRAAGLVGDVLIDDVHVRAMAEAAPPAPADDVAPRPKRMQHGVHP